MREYNGFQLFDELPPGWRFDNKTGSPLFGYSFATDGKSIIRGGKRALVKADPAQKPLLDTDANIPKIEPPKEDANYKKTKSSQVCFDKSSVALVNELARQRFKQRILNDILTDMMICEIEGWCKTTYLEELRKLINNVGRQGTYDQ